MHDIFISYSRRDIDVMNRVSESLREKGLTVWTDKGIEPGTQSWKNALADAILQCKYVIVLFSPDSSQSTWVSRELDYAELHQKKIYPLLVGGEISDSIPFGYTTYQFIDIRRSDQFEAGMDSLAASLTGTPTATTTTPQSNSVSVSPATGSQITLWKWIALERVHLTIPSDWKIYDPTPENIQKLQILMMGNDETLFYRAVEDYNSNFIKQATGFPIGNFASFCTMSSISNLSPLVGYLAEYTAPAPMPGILAPAVMSILKRRIVRFLRVRYRAEISESAWTRSETGRVYSHVWHFASILENTLGMTGKVYTIFPTLSRHTLFLNLVCEESRFDREQANFDQIARSLQFAYG